MMLLPGRCIYIADLPVPLISCTNTMTSQQQKYHARRRVDALIAQRAQSLKKQSKQFWQLIHVIRSRSRLLAPVSGTGFLNPSDAERVIQAGVRMTRRRHAWQRSPETWAVPDASPFVQMRSLVQHLFDKYPVPNFMAPVWWGEHNAQWGMKLYLHLAAGKSIRRFPVLPHFQITKRMAAFFMQAPDDLRPLETYRWSQVLSLGGDERLARILIRKTCLWAPNGAEAFWASVIRFLIQNAPLSTDEIVDIVQFIHQQRFEPAETVWGRGAGDNPVQPDFSLRGRSLMSLRRHMGNWRSELIEKGMMPPPDVDPLDFPWERSKIDAFHFEQDGIAWSIEELLTPRQLYNEGRIMNHCVSDYVSVCARRKTSIWSLKVQTGKRRRRQLTIEVLPKSKIIQQASGKHNCEPGETVREILNRWADREGLTFSESV